MELRGNVVAEQQSFLAPINMRKKVKAVRTLVARPPENTGVLPSLSYIKNGQNARFLVVELRGVEPLTF